MLKSDFIINLAQAVTREPVFVANIDQKQAFKYVQKLKEYSCETEAELYQGGKVFSLEYDENGREVGESSIGYVFSLSNTHQQPS